MEPLHTEVDLTAALLQALPEAVMYYVPVFSEQGDGEAIDFTIQYCNEEVCSILGESYSIIQGQTILTTDLIDDTTRVKVFQVVLHVWNTKKKITTSYFHNKFDKHFEAIRSAVPGGVISIIRDRTDQVKKQTALIEKERRFRSIVDAARDGVLILEPVHENGILIDFVIRYCNDYAIQAGHIPLDGIGRTLLELYPHLKGSEQFEKHRHVMNTGEPTRFETVFRDDEGAEYGWFIVSLTRVDGMVITRFTDISQNKASEREMQSQRDLLDSILDASASCILAFEAIRDKKSRIVDLLLVKINAAFTHKTGSAPEDVEGKSFLTLFTQKEMRDLFPEYRNVIESGQPYRTQLYYKGEGLDGWFDVTATPWGKNGVVVSYSDITESHTIKLELERSAHYMQQMIDVAPTGIFTLNPVRDHQGGITDFRFKTVNCTLAAYVGQQPEAMIGNLYSEWFPEYKTNGDFEIYKDIILRGREIRFERAFQYEKGEIWLDVVARKLDGDVIVSFHDFTQMKSLQLQLESLVEQLQQSNQSLEEFAYAASHDLQEPLRKISTLADKLRLELGDHLTTSQNYLFGRIYDSSQRMRQLIDDLLKLSQVGNKMELDEAVDMGQLVKQVFQDLDTAILESEVRLTVGMLPRIQGDESQLRQMFQNIIGNAIKYRRKDVIPQVSITSRLVRCDDPVLDEFPLAIQGHFHLITIADNGIGFEQQYAEQIFQVFSRLHNISDYPGTGIGLALVKKVVENHKGFIKAEGKPGEGAVFQILLPISL